MGNTKQINKKNLTKNFLMIVGGWTGGGYYLMVFIYIYIYIYIYLFVLFSFGLSCPVSFLSE